MLPDSLDLLCMQCSSLVETGLACVKGAPLRALVCTFLIQEIQTSVRWRCCENVPEKRVLLVNQSEALHQTKHICWHHKRNDGDRYESCHVLLQHPGLLSIVAIVVSDDSARMCCKRSQETVATCCQASQRMQPCEARREAGSASRAQRSGYSMIPVISMQAFQW